MKSYLAHYGILGQKWGLRRYQNSDGSLTSAGKSRYGESGDRLSRRAKKEIRNEYKTENKKAFEYGKRATISARAAEIARKKEARAKSRYERNPTEKRKEKFEAAKKLRKDLDKTAEENEQIAKNHYNELVQKYGKDHVSSIKYDKKGRVNEKVHTGKDYAIAAGLNVLSGVASAGLNTPVSMMFMPATKRRMAGSAYYNKRSRRANAGLNLTRNNIVDMRKQEVEGTNGRRL